MKNFRFFATLALFTTLALLVTITFIGWLRWLQYKNSSVSSNSDAAIGEREIIDLNKKLCTDNITDSSEIQNKLNSTIVFKCSFDLGQVGIINNNKSELIEMKSGDNSYLFAPYSPSLKDWLGLTRKGQLFKFVPIKDKSDMVITIKAVPLENSTKSFNINTSNYVECKNYTETVWSVDITTDCLPEGKSIIYFTNSSDVNFKLTGNQGESVILGGNNNKNNLLNEINLDYTNFGVHSMKLTTIPNN